MKALVRCPICEHAISHWTDELPTCRDHGVFGFWRRLWWATRIPSFFKSR